MAQTTPTTVSLKRQVGNDVVDYIVPIVEAIFSIKNETEGIIKWNDVSFSLDLGDEGVKTSWDKLVGYKEELLREKVSTYDIENFVQESINANVKAIIEQYDAKTSDIAQETAELIRKNSMDNDNRISQIKEETDLRIKEVREEYQYTVTQMQDLFNQFTESIKSISTDVKDIKETAKSVKTLKKDVKEMTTLFSSLLEE